MESRVPLYHKELSKSYNSSHKINSSVRKNFKSALFSGTLNQQINQTVIIINT